MAGDTYTPAIRHISAKAPYAIPLCSSMAVLVLYNTVFWLLDQFDWDQSFTRFISLAILAALAITARSPKSLITINTRYRPAALLSACLIVYAVINGVGIASKSIMLPVPNDIGTTVQEAAIRFFNEGLNPYQIIISRNYGQGFHYGPGMFLGYALCALTPDHGIKFMNVPLLMLSILFVYLLGANKENSQNPKATGLFAVALFLLPHRIWSELFEQGVIDMLPMMLILASLYAAGKKSWAWAGFCAGLSFSVKFSPAVMLIMLLVAGSCNRRFLAGGLIGLVPMFPFFYWDSVAMIHNSILFHLTKTWDTTSIYSITPAALHFTLPLFQLAALAIILSRACLQPRIESTLYWLLLLITATEMVYVQIHGNHLIWLLPLAAVHFSNYRYAFLPRIAQLLLPPPPSPNH